MIEKSGPTLASLRLGMAHSLSPPLSVARSGRTARGFLRRRTPACACRTADTAHYTGDQPIVREHPMGACFSLPEQHHLLLKHLTTTKRTRRRTTLVARGGPEDWSSETGLPPETVRLAVEDLLIDCVLYKDKDLGLVINQPCTCSRVPAGNLPAASTVSTGLQLKEQSRETDVRKVAPPPYSLQGSALQMPRSEGVSDDEVSDEEAERFLNGAPAEDPAPARRMSPTQELVEFFLLRVPAQAKRQGIRLMPTTISAKALGGQIRRMLNEGMTPDEVRAMIILFAKQYGRFHKAEADPAKVFLANRRRLFKQCQEQSRLSVERDPEKFAKKAAVSGRRYATLEDLAARRAANQ